MSRVLDLIGAAHGQCRLSVQSTTTLKLAPYNGDNLNIYGMVQQIPAAGVTITNSGLASSTLYYVYAYMAADVMTLELSATGHSTHTTGVEIKAGDSSRTLVGMVYANSSTQFVDDISSITCANWFNRRLRCGATSTIVSAITSGTFVELTTAGRVPFLAWADEAVDAVVVGSVSTDAAGNTVHTTSPGIDAAGGAQTVTTTYAASVGQPAYGRIVTTVAEGYHFAGAFGKVSAGTGTWNYGTQVLTRC